MIFSHLLALECAHTSDSASAAETAAAVVEEEARETDSNSRSEYLRTGAGKEEEAVEDGRRGREGTVTGVTAAASRLVLKVVTSFA